MRDCQAPAIEYLTRCSEPRARLRPGLAFARVGAMPAGTDVLLIIFPGHNYTLIVAVHRYRQPSGAHRAAITRLVGGWSGCVCSDTGAALSRPSRNQHEAIDRGPTETTAPGAATA
jgi:hypothetical protein